MEDTCAIARPRDSSDSSLSDPDSFKSTGPVTVIQWRPGNTACPNQGRLVGYSDS